MLRLFATEVVVDVDEVVLACWLKVGADTCFCNACLSTAMLLSTPCVVLTVCRVLPIRERTLSASVPLVLLLLLFGVLPLPPPESLLLLLLLLCSGEETLFIIRGLMSDATRAEE